jgi:hypothetical protein
MQIPRAMRKILSIPILGDMVAYVRVFPIYIFMRLTMPPIFLLSGYQRIRCGTSFIWSPKNRKQTILDGIEVLRVCGPEMYSRLTSKQRLIIFYTGHAGKWNTSNLAGRVFSLDERYIELGSQGVAMFFAQALLLSETSPAINQVKVTENQYRAPRRVLDWMCEHSFHPGLIKSYRKVVQKWESQEHFRDVRQSLEMIH